MVESPPADAGDTGSCPSPGRSHMPQSGCAREPWPLSLCSATGEAAAVGGPRTAKKPQRVYWLILSWKRQDKKASKFLACRDIGSPYMNKEISIYH